MAKKKKQAPVEVEQAPVEAPVEVEQAMTADQVNWNDVLVKREDALENGLKALRLKDEDLQAKEIRVENSLKNLDQMREKEWKRMKSYIEIVKELKKEITKEAGDTVGYRFLSANQKKNLDTIIDSYLDTLESYGTLSE